MARDFLAELAKRRLVSDGAMGTMLFARGLPQGACPEEWNVSHPDDVQAIHQAYFDAGCDLVETNTFGGTAIKLNDYNVGDRMAEWNRKAAEIARKAAGEQRFVAGSIGPIGQLLKPYGALAEEDAAQAFAAQAVALQTGGADVAFVETMISLEETVIAVKAIKASTSLPVVATMTFEQKKKGYRTMMGTSPEQAVEALQQAGADVVGTNCGAGPDLTVGVLQAMRAVTNGYLIAQPNAGLPELHDGKNIYTMTPAEMTERMKPLLDLDVRVIGGCCGTNPDYLRAIAAMVKGA